MSKRQGRLISWFAAAVVGWAIVAYCTFGRARLGAEERHDDAPEPVAPTEIVANPDPWAAEDQRPQKTRTESADGTMTVFPIGGTTAMPCVEIRPMRRLLTGKLVPLEFSLLRLHRVGSRWQNGYQFDESHPALRLGVQEQEGTRNLVFGATYELEGHALKPRFTVPKDIGQRKIARFELLVEDDSQPPKAKLAPGPKPPAGVTLTGVVQGIPADDLKQNPRKWIAIYRRGDLQVSPIDAQGRFRIPHVQLGGELLIGAGQEWNTYCYVAKVEKTDWKMPKEADQTFDITKRHDLKVTWRPDCLPPKASALCFYASKSSKQYLAVYPIDPTQESVSIKVVPGEYCTRVLTSDQAEVLVHDKVKITASELSLCVSEPQGQ